MNSRFDYIVIGGGSAGSIMAGRLSAAGAEVLVLEAGGTDQRPDVRIPAGVVAVYRSCNWKYVPEPDRSRGGATEAWPAGRILGGGGSINATVFVRGNRADFDGWAADGCGGWDYDAVLPYFKRLEQWAGGGDEFRGEAGPIHVGLHTMDHPANEAFTDAAQQAGHKCNEDYNGRTQEGVGQVQVNQKRGFRSQSSHEYLRGIANQNHLQILKKAYVNRIFFKGDRAVGVEFVHRGHTQEAWVNREVILSAGSIASPKILQLSGIGPASELERLRIPVVHDAPLVGANLQEHASVMQRWNADVPTINTMGFGGALKSVVEYARKGTGNLAATVFHVQVMHRTTEGIPAPDMQLAFANFATTRETDSAGALKIQPARVNGFLVTALFLHPRGRGRVGLRSSNPQDRPVIEHELLGDRRDLNDLLSGMAEARRIMAQPAMGAMASSLFAPEDTCQSDGDWEEFARQNATYGAHPVGTCRMGSGEDAVVGTDLRVNGVSGLRVVDASVMPTSPSGNTNAPTMMIAERAADLVMNGK